MHRRLAGALALGMTLALAVPGASATAASRQLPSPRLVAELPTGEYGSFAESLALDADGSLYVSVASWSADEVTANEGQIWRINPNGKIARYGPSLAVCLLTGLAFDDAGRLYVGTYSCEADFAIPSGVLRINADGSATQVLTLPAGSFPNGLAFHRGDLYVSDSIGGAIWRVRPRGGTNLRPTTPWLQDALLEPGDEGLGVNGIAFRGDTLTAVNYSTGDVISVPVRKNGSPGTPQVVASDPILVQADGVAFDRLGRLWVAVNSGLLARVDPSGDVTVVTDDEAWLDYPAQAAFGRTGRNTTTLYVLNGAFFNGCPNVVALDAGIAGQVLP